jgi:esterase/lipase superfamily enzyme
VRHVVLAAALVAGLAACAQRGAIIIDPEAAATGSVVEVFMATSRGGSDSLSIAPRARSRDLRYGVFDVSVPPDRVPGTVTFPSAAGPDPATDFLTVASRPFADDAAFLAAVNASLAARSPGDREVAVFVHGFNTNFAEGLYGHAQMAHDFQSPGVSVSYSWPSAGNVGAYGFDRESALFARDGLERLLSLLARSSADDIVLGGHSMGSAVVMETVRQMAIRGDDRTLDRIQAVVLMAPDLDPELFEAEVLDLAPRVMPIYVTVSTRDRALRASGILRGQSERLGSIADPSRIAALPGVEIIDLTDLQGAEDPLNHFAVATSPVMISYIRGLDRYGQAIVRDADRSAGPLTATLDVISGVADQRRAQ